MTIIALFKAACIIFLWGVAAAYIVISAALAFLLLAHETPLASLKEIALAVYWAILWPFIIAAILLLLVLSILTDMLLEQKPKESCQSDCEKFDKDNQDARNP